MSEKSGKQTLKRMSDRMIILKKKRKERRQAKLYSLNSTKSKKSKMRSTSLKNEEKT